MGIQVTAPRYNKAIDIVKSNTVNFDGSNATVNAAANAQGGPFQALACDSIFVGSTGDVAVVFDDGSATGDVHVYTVTVVPYILPVKAIRVNATNTTASKMIAQFCL